MEEKYPTILRRYFSTFIDWFLLMSVFIASMTLIEGNDQFTSALRFILPLLVIVLYEPVLTSKACTIGQYITGIRVRNAKDHSKISVVASYFRLLIKILLGVISLVMIVFSERDQAIHDYMVTSVVLVNKSGAS